MIPWTTCGVPARPESGGRVENLRGGKEAVDRSQSGNGRRAGIFLFHEKLGSIGERLAGQFADGREIVGRRHFDAIERNNLHIGDQSVARAGAADQIFQLQLVLPEFSLRVNQILPRGRDLVLRRGDVEHGQRSEIQALDALVIELLRGVHRVLFRFQVVKVRSQSIVAVQHAYHGAGNLGLEVQVRHAEVDLRHVDGAGVDRHAEALQQILLDGDRQGR